MGVAVVHLRPIRLNGCAAEQRHNSFTSRVKKDPIPSVPDVGWASKSAWTDMENFAPPGFGPRTIEPVASRFTNYAIPNTCIISAIQSNLIKMYEFPVFNFVF